MCIGVLSTALAIVHGVDGAHLIKLLLRIALSALLQNHIRIEEVPSQALTMVD